MRQTQLAVKEILEALGGRGFSPYPSCLLINELGEICLERKGRMPTENATVAEETLRSLLDSRDSMRQVVAYSCLAFLQDPSETTSLKLESFRRDPRNTSLVMRADRNIQRLREQQ